MLPLRRIVTLVSQLGFQINVRQNVNGNLDHRVKESQKISKKCIHANTIKSLPYLLIFNDKTGQVLIKHIHWFHIF